jgi:MAE_28990/MAE_18760-like HEPN
MPAIAMLRKLEKDIESDLDWRQAELAVFREMLTLSAEFETRKRALFRAGWALLYAHYEGFSKFCLDLYIEFVGRSLSDCHMLPDKMFVYLIEKEIQDAKALSPEDIFLFFREKIHMLRSTAPKTITVDTKSNLWPASLAKLLGRLDLNSSCIIEHERKLKTLVARRNDIAHGKKVFIDDIKYYLEYENSVLNTMYGLALAVGERSARFTGSLAASAENSRQTL